MTLTNHAATLSCPDCGGGMRLVPAGKFGPFYSCTNWPSCSGAHGMHPDGRPLGKPANAETRAARMRAHATFDRLWQNAPSKRRGRKRRRMYALLREFLGMTWDECHIANFDLETCNRVRQWAEDRLAERKAGNT